MSMFERLKLIRAAIQLVRQPENLDEIFELVEALSREDEFIRIVGEVRNSSPRADQAFRRRLRVEPVTLEELAACGAGTLGRAFADHCRRGNLDPAIFFGRDAETEADYLVTHLYETHDIWHAVTGFETDVAGELGLQAFYLAQFPSLLAMMILPLGMLNTVIYQRDDHRRRMDAITRGWQMGKSAELLVGYDWSASWHRPLAEVQAELGLQTATDVASVSADSIAA